MLLHRNLVGPVVEALKHVFGDGDYAAYAVERTLRLNRKWGARDRHFVAETIYDTVRWWRLLWECRGQPPSLEDGPLWHLVGVGCVLKGEALPPWEEFAGLVPADILARQRAAAATRRLRESIPDWLDELGERELGAQWEKEVHELNQPARVVLRANTLKTNAAELERMLHEQGIATDRIEWLPDALALRDRQNALATAAFRNGLFEVQDASSQLVAPFLEPGPGLRVVDACAGAGGKTLHLAALMGNKGRIVALDVDERRLDELARRARRAAAFNIETRSSGASKVLRRLHEGADRVLLDVPCSGLGVLRRNPDTKWKLSPERLDALRRTQQELLERHAPILGPGGRLVYATCSILPSENQEQVARFLQTHGDRFALLEERTILPSEHGFDGFYMARLERKT